MSTSADASLAPPVEMRPALPLTEQTIAARLERLPYSRWHVRVTIILGVAIFFDSFDSLAIAYVLPVIIRDWSIPPEQVVGTAGGTKYGFDKEGRPDLTKEPKLLLNDNFAGKPEGIHLVIGRRPHAAFGNSTGDQQMLEYATIANGAGLGMLILHDDSIREYAYGPAEGLPDTKVGTFTQPLYEEAKKRGWSVISMKNDWKRLFPFEDGH